ncbi:hypothetical protein C8R48DRAFT_734566 [Suillus tomentosus]|nr:hypothetical protein C8R48DRAFT_734566 [Suillus tomentosus]
MSTPQDNVIPGSGSPLCKPLLDALHRKWTEYQTYHVRQQTEELRVESERLRAKVQTIKRAEEDLP